MTTAISIFESILFTKSTDLFTYKEVMKANQNFFKGIELLFKDKEFQDSFFLSFDKYINKQTENAINILEELRLLHSKNEVIAINLGILYSKVEYFYKAETVFADAMDLIGHYPFKMEVYNLIKKNIENYESSGKSYSKLAPLKSEYPIVYLTSYPRSGNTYMRSILGSLLNIRNYSVFPGDGIYFSRRLYNPNLKEIRIVKDHWYHKIYEKDKCIYLVRDGRDAMLSLAYYTHKEGKHSLLKKGEFSKFINFISDNYSFKSWADNVSKALEAKKRGASIKIIKYEDVYLNADSLKDLIYFIKPTNDLSVENVKDELLKVEQKRKEIKSEKWGYFENITEDSYLFKWSKNRTKSNWKTCFDKEAKKAFHNTGATEILLKLGYETDANWWEKD